MTIDNNKYVLASAEEAQVEEWIRESYKLVASKLPKAVRQQYIQEPILHKKSFQELTTDELSTE